MQNSFDLLALNGLRIKRVILARETPTDLLKEIKRRVDEVEVFVQGAMCVSFSGGCLLGSKMYGSSGNRGVCNQPCRLTYEAVDERGNAIKVGKLLSPCDLSIGERVTSPSFSCVDSIKIEGRLKRPQYVYSATKYYRELLDGRNSEEALYDLKESFNRGFTDGYTLNKSKRIINPLTSSHLGIPVGSVDRVTEKKGYKYALVRSKYDFVKGDGAKILRNGSEVGGSDVTSSRRVGDLWEIPVSDGVRSGDIVCLTTNARKVEAAERMENTLPVDFVVRGEVGARLTLTATCAGISATVESASVAEASHSADNAALLSKFSKIGGTDFILHSLDSVITAPVYVNPSELADMRRKVLAELKRTIIDARTPRFSFKQIVYKGAVKRSDARKTVFEVEKIDDPFYRKADAVVLDPQDMTVDSLREQVNLAEGRDCYLRLPKILREKELDFLKSVLERVPSLGVYADNLYAVGMARELGRRYIAGFGLNVFNKAAEALFQDATFVARSVEIPATDGSLAFAAGKVRLMSFAHCPFSVVYDIECKGCDRSKRFLRYRCGEKRYLILRHRSASCDFTMFEDRVSYYDVSVKKKNDFYSFVGLSLEEKSAMMKYISEAYSE